nr:putative nucleotidyltransferase, ribonuclease H [Tanacetum cinerariifolium]
MDFVTGLPTTQKRHDAIWVVVDRLTKSAHFLPIRKNYSISKLEEIFRQEIVRMHGTPTSIVSNRDPRFTSRFWNRLQKAWGTRLKFSTAFHPQIDGQSERTIQTLEDMLRACALEWTGNWDEYLCLVKFAYNNSWHASIKAAPFELLYGRKCRVLICWNEVDERLIEGLELIEITNEKVAVAKEKLKEARSNVIVKFECIDARVKFDIFNDENDVLSYCMFVIFAKEFSLLSAESEDTIFDPEIKPKMQPVPRRQNRRRVLKIVEPVIHTIEEGVPMVDRTMEELLQAPTEGFEETFGEAWERFKEMLRACPHHGFSELTQIDTFYNVLNEQDQDSLNAAAGGNLLSKTTREALKIIKNKSKVHYSRGKSNVSRVNTNSRESSSKTDDRIDNFADQILNLVEIVNKQVITPATVKAVEKSCVICGGAHAYYDCIATDSNQSSVCATTGTYNQVSPPN